MLRMWQGRELILCTLAVLAGNLLGDALPLPPFCYLLLSLGFVFMALRRPTWPWLLLSLVLLGAFSVQAGRMPAGTDPSALTQWAATQKENFSIWLGQFAPPGEELAILRALAIGDKSDLTRDLRAAYRESGAMHLLALSGLHVGLIYALLRWLLTSLGGHRAMRLLRGAVILSSLWTYALITGLSASITRAVLMITFYEFAGWLTGDRDGLTSLAGSALLLMVFDPEVPRDIGFQLSYTAVLSILLFYPWLSRRLQTRSRLLKKVWELLSVSLCCQATCGVLAWLYFGTFPRYFLLTTLLAIPLATAVMYAIAAAVASAGISSLISGVSWLSSATTWLSASTSAVLNWLLHLLNTLIRLIAEL